jgi:gluconolactonase
MIAILRDRGLSDLLADRTLERLADGFQFTEGPLWMPDDSVLFQDVHAERTYRIDPHGTVTLVREHTAGANGQTFGKNGRVVFCEQNGRRVSTMDATGGSVTTLAETWNRKRLNSPNDIVCRSDGVLYFTDPPYGVPSPEQKEIPFQAVFSLPPSGEPTPLVQDFEKPNGLAFSPDEQTLYVCDTGKYHVRAFAVRPSGELDASSGRVIAEMDPGQPGGPDGMKVDRDGRLYVAVALGVWVFEPSGQLLGIIPVPKRPSNLAWCGADGRELFITAVDAVYKIRLKVSGILPPFTPGGPKV